MSFIVELLFVCASDGNIVQEREWLNTKPSEALAHEAWKEIAEHRASFSCPCADSETHTVEINVTHTRSGDAMGTENPRSEAEVDAFFKDDWFETA